MLIRFTLKVILHMQLKKDEQNWFLPKICPRAAVFTCLPSVRLALYDAF